MTEAGRQGPGPDCLPALTFPANRPQSGRDRGRPDRERAVRTAAVPVCPRNRDAVDTTWGKVEEFLDGHEAMTLATCCADQPWATTVFYARRELVFYFFSALDARHSSNIHRNPRVAAAVSEAGRGWQRIKGIQMEGIAERVPILEVPMAIAVYLRKFPFVASLLAASPPTEQKTAPPRETQEFRVGTKVFRARLYKFRPDRLFYLDNEIGFGRRTELAIPSRYRRQT